MMQLEHHIQKYQIIYILIQKMERNMLKLIYSLDGESGATDINFDNAVNPLTAITEEKIKY